jgi:hypothetical protein
MYSVTVGMLREPLKRAIERLAREDGIKPVFILDDVQRGLVRLTQHANVVVHADAGC